MPGVVGQLGGAAPGVFGIGAGLAPITVGAALPGIGVAIAGIGIGVAAAGGIGRETEPGRGWVAGAAVPIIVLTFAMCFGPGLGSSLIGSPRCRARRPRRSCGPRDRDRR